MATREELAARLRSIGAGYADTTRSLNAFLDDLRELLDDIPEEEHECWFEMLSFDYGNIALRCKCGVGAQSTRAETETIYNAMRHLNAEILSLAAKGYILAEGERDALRAAAEAMRK